MAGSASSIEDFSPTSTFHASPEAAFPKPLDLALTMILHRILLIIKDDRCLLLLVLTSPTSILLILILLPKANKSKIRSINSLIQISH